MPFVNFLVHSYTCCSDRHASPYWTFIRRWISMGFAPSLLNKRLTDSVLLWCMLQAGPPSLHYYCAVVLRSCIVLPPVSHSSNDEYHCCQLTKQSSIVLNFYRTFKVFIWLSLVYYELKINVIYAKNLQIQHNCIQWPKYHYFSAKKKKKKMCHLTHWGRVTQICVFTLQLCKTDDANLRF